MPANEVNPAMSKHTSYDVELTGWRAYFPFLIWVRLLNRQTIIDDLLAGLTGAVIVLPQGVAYAIIAGLPPEYGLYAAIIPTIIAALFGSSWHLISGPTVAMSIVIYTAITPLATPGSPEFVKLALTLTLLAGLFQFALGLARMGTLVNFVSHSVVVGFTAGAAVLIATSQLKNVLGLNISAGSSFIHNLLEVGKHLGETNVYVLTVAVITLIVSLLFKKIAPRLPGMLFAMIAGSLVALLLDAHAHGIKLVGSLPSQLPPFSLPSLSPTEWQYLATPALAIGLLGLVEAVSIARSVATRSNQLIDGNQEFIGQGLSNIIGAFFSGYASSGSFTRTGVNYEAGARTPLAAIFASLFLTLIILLIAPLTAYVPIPSMAGVLLLVAYNLIDFHHIKAILKVSRSESSVLIVTFLSTLFLELEFAIYIGVLLSLMAYLSRTSKPHIVAMSPDPSSPKRSFTNLARNSSLVECPQLKIVRIDGSLFFGAVNHVIRVLQSIKQKHLLIVSSGINFIDVAGAEMLAQEAKRRRSLQGNMYLTKVKMRAHDMFERGGYLHEIKAENIFNSKDVAIHSILSQLDQEVCAQCTARIFLECPKKLDK